MEALSAAVAAYLAIGLYGAWNMDDSASAAALGPQLRLAGLVLAAALLWPSEYWRRAREDWNNYFLD